MVGNLLFALLQVVVGLENFLTREFVSRVRQHHAQVISVLASGHLCTLGTAHPRGWHAKSSWVFVATSDVECRLILHILSHLKRQRVVLTAELVLAVSVATFLLVLTFALLLPVLAKLSLEVRVRHLHHLHHELWWQRLQNTQVKVNNVNKVWTIC